MSGQRQYSMELRERATRMALEARAGYRTLRVAGRVTFGLSGAGKSVF